MSIRVAINGFGRIGKNVLRALYERELNQSIEVVAINDLGQCEAHAHLFKYDSTHGTFAGEVSAEADCLTINRDSIAWISQRDPSQLPWRELEIDVVFECSGLFTSRTTARAHLDAGAKRVVISAPGKDVDATIVYGVNHEQLTADMSIISNASCTTNCLAPIVKVLNQANPIEHGLMTTIHAFTNDQNLVDGYHSDLHRARSATGSMIPTKTGAAAAVGLVIPELAGRLDGLAVRVPTQNVSLVDLTVTLANPTSVAEVNQLLSDASTQAQWQGVLSTNSLPLVSIDFNHNSHSSIVDLSQTRVQGNLVKLMAWYDNEWAFSHRMLDTTLAWFAKINASSEKQSSLNQQRNVA